MSELNSNSTPTPTLSKYPHYMQLNIFIDPKATTNADDLKTEYLQRARNHNANVKTTTDHIDSGFDLLAPTAVTPQPHEVTYKLNHAIKCSAYYCQRLIEPSLCYVTYAVYGLKREIRLETYPTGYCLYPRSSIIKTPFRLANSVGVIDSGYRGNIIAALDCRESGTTIGQYDRLVQICAPDLCPILVNIVDTEEELGEPTQRGEGGFGSTGK